MNHFKKCKKVKKHEVKQLKIKEKRAKIIIIKITQNMRGPL